MNIEAGNRKGSHLKNSRLNAELKHHKLNSYQRLIKHKIKESMRNDTDKYSYLTSQITNLNDSQPNFFKLRKRKR